MINEIQSLYNTPQLQKACQRLGRKLLLPKASTSFDMAEIGGKVILSSERVDGKRVLLLYVDKPKSNGLSRLMKGTYRQAKVFLKENSAVVAKRIEELEQMMARAAENTEKFMTGF